MASVTGRVLDLQGFRGADDAVAADTAFTRLERFLVTIDHNGTAVTTSDTLDVNVAAALAAQLRRGKAASSYAVRYATIEQCAVARTTAGVDTVLAGTLAISGTTTVQITPKAAADNSTAASIGATDALARPYRLLVCVNEA